MRPCRVLVVDDEADFLESLVRRLCRRGLEAVGVASGEDALERLSGEAFDVAVLDVKMPGLDGIEVLRRLKKQGSRVEVILLTGHASVESGVDGVELGAFDYLIKPVKLDDLFERIRDAYEELRDPRRRAGSMLFSADPDASLVSLLDESRELRRYVGPEPWIDAMKER